MNFDSVGILSPAPEWKTCQVFLNLKFIYFDQPEPQIHKVSIEKENRPSHETAFT